MTGPVSPRDEKKKPRRTWLRRLLRVAIVLVALVVLLRLAVPVVLPFVLDSVAGGYGLTCEYDDIDLGLLTGEVEIHGLTLTPEEGGPPVARLRLARVDVDVLSLLDDRIVVDRVEVDGFEFWLGRNADGRWPLLERIARAQEAEQQDEDEPEDAEAEPEETPPLSLDAPVEIRALRIQDVRVTLRDATVPLETRIDAQVMLTDLGASGRPARLEIEVTATEILQSFRVRAVAETSPDALGVDLDVRFRGLRPGPLADYLAGFGLRPTADVVEAGLAARLDATVTGPHTLAAKATIDRMALTADGAETAAVDRVVIEANEIGATAVDLARVFVGGVRWRGSRTVEGALATAGFEFLPVPETAGPPEAATGHAPAPATAVSPTEPMRFRVADVLVTDVRAEFADPSRERPLDVRIRELRVDGYEAGDEAPLRLLARLSAPGILEELRLDGEVAPFAKRRTLDLAVELTGLEPGPVADALAASGWQPTFESAALSCRLAGAVELADDATIGGTLDLSDLLFTADARSVALGRVRATGLTFVPDTVAARVDLLEIGGLGATVRIDEAGALHVPGFRQMPPPAGPTEPAGRDAAVVVADGPAAEPGPTPRIEIAHLRIADNAIDFRDESMSPAADIRVADVGVDIRDLALDLAPGATPSPATLRAWLKAPGLAEELVVSGTVAAGTASVVANLEVRGHGLTARTAAPFLAAAGLASELENGELSLDVAARVDVDGESLRATLVLGSLVVADAGTELAGCDAVRVTGLAMGPDRIAVEAIEIERPRARVRRDADGTLHALGFVPTTRPATVRAPAGPRSSGAGAVDADPPPSTPTLELGRLRLVGAALAWTDESTGETVVVTPTLDVALDGMSFVEGRARAKGRIELRVPEDGTRIVATAEVEGSHAIVDLAGEGIRRGALGPYLPPDLVVTLRDGRLRARLEAEIGEAEGGGPRILAEIRDLDYRDGEGGDPLLAFESLRVRVPRIDPDGGVVDVEEISLRGLETHARRDRTGTIRAMGLEIGSAAKAQVEPVAAPSPGTPGSAPAPRGSLRDRLQAASGRALPRITIGTIDLRASRATFADETAPDPRPIELANLRVWTAERVEFDGEDPEESAPILLNVAASAPPVLDSLAITTHLQPFAAEPEATIEISLAGIRGGELSRRLPALAAAIDAGKIQDGKFGLRAHAVLRSRRKDALDFDLSRGFGADLVVEAVRLENGDGEELAGIDEIHVDLKRMDPATGDVHVKTVEITGARGNVTREPDGLRVLGLLLRDRPAAATAAEPGSTGDPARGASPASGTTAKDPEIRVDSLYVSGLRSRISDVSVDPPFLLPIEDLTFEVRGFTTRAFTERIPIQFSTLVRAGKIDFPNRKETGSPLEEIAASGRLTFHPHLDGWVKAGVSALDLENLGGLAKAAGVDLNGGVLDMGLSVRFREDGAMDTSTRISLTDLDLSEPPDGPISKLLVLPAPLDVVIFVLEDAGGAIDIPLDVRVDEDGVGTGAIVGQSLKVLTTLIAGAVASSPFKVLGTAGSLFGMGGEEEMPSDEPPIEIDFAAGDTGLRSAAREALDALIERMDDEEDLAIMLEHEPGRGDLDRMQVRANPSREDCLDLITNLRRRKLEILRARTTAAADARAAMAAASDETADAARRHLASLDHELGLTEQALDRVAALLKPGSERQSTRRTREASIALGRLRLREVHTILMASGVPNAAARVRLRRPRPTEPERDGGGRILVGLTRMAETD